tara:strand:+ start:3681 stop:4670 length:990 start_codon:yes stop_codon:yes gene_type:complete
MTYGKYFGTELFLGLLLVVYFVLLAFGKYRAIDAASGNPYEQAREYLKDNTKENDLIIGIGSGGIRETTGNFYFSDLIRSKIKQINEKKMIKNIFVLTSHIPVKDIPLKKYFSNQSSEVEGFLKMEYFKLVAYFRNSGVRGKRVYIFRSSVSEQQGFYFDHQNLASIGFFGQDGAQCKTSSVANGVRLFCGDSRIACSNRYLNLPLKIKGDYYLFGLLNHVNDVGTNSKSAAFLNPAKISSAGFQFDNKDFKTNLFFANFLTDQINNLDKFEKNISQNVVHFQKLSRNRSLLLCIQGQLFQDNALIKNITFINMNLHKEIIKPERADNY